MLFFYAYLVLVNFSTSNYDVNANETMAVVRVTAFGEFRNPFLVNVTVSATEQSERSMLVMHNVHMFK